MIENDFLKIEVGGERIALNSENVHCIIHAVGKVAVGDIVRNSSDFDHIRITERTVETKQGKEEIYGYLFRGAPDDVLFGTEAFEKVSQLVEEMGASIETNANEVDDYVIEFFYDYINNSSHFEAKNIDDSLNNLIDSYWREGGGFNS